MWQRLLQLLVLVLVGLAFLGGTTVQALPPDAALAPAAAVTSMLGCTDLGMMQDDGTPVPRKGITPDCVKLTKCLGIPSLPLQAGPASAPVAYAVAAYWPNSRLPGGLSHCPVPFPPRPA